MYSEVPQDRDKALPNSLLFSHCCPLDVMNLSDNHPNLQLPRTLEPEAMDSAEEVREYREMNHELVNQCFVSDLIAGGSVGPKVVDLGCGTAQIPVYLCQQRGDVQVMGIDASIEMLEAARIEIELGGVQGRVFLEHADCKALAEFESEMADTVISNSLIHHVAEPTTVVDCGIRILKPGGRLFIRDLVRPASERDVEALVMEHAGNESEFARQLLRQSFHAALTLDEIQSLAQSLGIPSETVNLTSDRHWTLDWEKP